MTVDKLVIMLQEEQKRGRGNLPVRLYSGDYMTDCGAVDYESEGCSREDYDCIYNEDTAGIYGNFDECSECEHFQEQIILS